MKQLPDKYSNDCTSSWTVQSGRGSDGPFADALRASPHLLGADMKLKLRQTAYSSVVGGGITFVDEYDTPVYLLMVIGTTKGISKEHTAQIIKQILDKVSEVEVTDS